MYVSAGTVRVDLPFCHLPPPSPPPRTPQPVGVSGGPVGHPLETEGAGRLLGRRVSTGPAGQMFLKGGTIAIIINLLF